MFEGEKYLGSTKDSFDVVSISIWPQQGTSLKGLVHEDFHYIEQKINETVSRCENRLEISSKGISPWYKFFANSFGLSWLNEREATQIGLASFYLFCFKKISPFDNRHFFSK